MIVVCFEDLAYFDGKFKIFALRIRLCSFLFLVVIFFVVLLGVFVVFLLYGGMFLLSIKDYSVFKVFSFERGFLSVGKVQISFSVHFFLMMLVFVVFDLEVILLLGLVVSDCGSLGRFLVLFLFVLGGFFLEWWYGKLVWLVYWIFLFLLFFVCFFCVGLCIFLVWFMGFLGWV